MSALPSELVKQIEALSIAEQLRLAAGLLDNRQPKIAAAVLERARLSLSLVLQVAKMNETNKESAKEELANRSVLPR